VIRQKFKRVFIRARILESFFEECGLEFDIDHVEISHLENASKFNNQLKAIHQSDLREKLEEWDKIMSYLDFNKFFKD